MKRSQRFDPVFFFCNTYPSIGKDMATCEEHGLSFILSQNLNTIPAPAPVSTGRDLKARAHHRLPASLRPTMKRLVRWGLSVTTSRNFFYRIWHLLRLIKEVRQVIHSQAISLLILPADNRYDQAAYVHASHLEDKPVVLVPQFMASPLEWAEFVWDKSEHQLGRWTNRLFAKLYPRWVYEHKGRKLLALPASQAVAHEWLGIAPPLPWVLHSGRADIVAVEGDAVRDYGVSVGLPFSKFKVTGSLAHDALADGIANADHKRSQLCRALSLPPDCPVILSALPPDSIYMGRPECDFRTYAELVEFWCCSLAAVQGYNAILCLHPSAEYDEMKFVEDWGVRIAPGRTFDLIPLCDIFVASISATIQWAIACGKPVVNYDVYRYRYTDYLGIRGVVTIEEQDQFVSVIRRLAQDSEYYAELEALQSAESSRWGQLDGKAGQRLVQLFEEILHNCAEAKNLAG